MSPRASKQLRNRKTNRTPGKPKTAPPTPLPPTRKPVEPTVEETVIEDTIETSNTPPTGTPNETLNNTVEEPGSETTPNQETFTPEPAMLNNNELDHTHIPAPNETTLNDPTPNPETLLNGFKALGLPPHVTSWKIVPSPYDPSHHIIIHYVDGQPVSHMLISASTMEDYLLSLNQEMLTTPENLADSWFIKTPDDPEQPPALYLTTNGVLTNRIPLTRNLMRDLMPKMLKVYNPEQPTQYRKTIFQWAKDHKIKATMLAIILFGPFVYGLYTFIF